MAKRSVLAASVCVAICLLSTALSAADSGKPHKPRPPRPAAWKPAPQEMYVAYWSTEPGWNTQVEIRNNIAWRDLTVTPVLRTSDGAEIPLPPVTVASNEVKDVDLRQALGHVALDTAWLS